MRLLDALLPASRFGDLSLAEAFGDPLNGYTTYSFGGQSYVLPVETTMPGSKAESIGNSFEGYVTGALAGNGVIFGLISTRLRVFSQIRFQFQQINGGRPGDLFGTSDLSVLERPWPGGTTSDLLATMILHADLAGNAYLTIHNDQVVAMRPDWVDIVLAERQHVDSAGNMGTLGMEKVGYAFWQGGKNSGVKPIVFLADEVAHFAPQPDPLASYRGMSWITPVLREIRADGAMTSHKLAFMENSATPNLAVSLKEITDPEQFSKFVDTMDAAHRGVTNAGKTLYLGAGADVTVVGANMHELDFKVTQGAGETRLAQAAGVPPVVAGLSEGLQGSSLNAGNFGSARRMFSDMTLAHLWGNVAASLETLVPAPSATSRLWYDTRDVAFLREDQSDLASIQASNSQAIRELFMAGFEPSSIIAAVTANDLKLLKHTGLYSIQVQSPGVTSTKLPSTVDEPPPGPPGSTPEKPLPLGIPAANGSRPA